MLIALERQGHVGKTKPWARRQEMWAQNSLSNTASLCPFWKVTPPLGMPLSSFEKEVPAMFL